ncbi:MAG: carbohydrate ABC transporter permease [Clostridium beijerinckii]|nr:carbohydrate ABC transporter permease [Clostridium beijerinckii]MCI1578266.1 carbohydrate ABC transporter permease [Clostridium beijerinckii]MCI1583810.1 carbohydrate ABC transporter permease [Clostridium beijerinckii]MCI1621465.1 carbohydrate ABC transporter permease [Clostridium beijerinckii]
MVKNKTIGGKISDLTILIVIAIVTLLCLLPLLNMIAISFSHKSAAAGNLVGLLPVGFTTVAYEKLLADSQFWRSFLISVERVILGTALNVIIIVLTAYPLSKTKENFKMKNIYMHIFIFCMLFSGGMVPIYLTVKNLNMLNSIWALILPGAVPIFNVILMMNFFKGIPKSLEESATIDGATPLQVLFKIYLPISLPALATVTLFCIVGHWNDFFSGILYMNSPEMYPLQTYIQQLNIEIQNITNVEQLKQLEVLSNKTLNAAKIVVSMVPLLCIYPFMQKYFITGLVMGSVKE